MIELKRGGGDQLFIWFMVGMCGLLVLLFGFAGWALIGDGEPSGSILFAMALPFVGLTYYVYREAVARSLTRIAINWQTLELRLPPQRSYVPQQNVETSLPLASITAIESRFRSQVLLAPAALIAKQAEVGREHLTERVSARCHALKLSR